MANHLAKARDEWKAAQAFREKKEKEAKDVYLAGAKECLARIEKLHGVSAKKDLAEWFDQCRLWLLITKNDRQAKPPVNKKRKEILSASTALLKALDEPGIDVLAEIFLGSYDKADEFFATLCFVRKQLDAPRNPGPKRDEIRDKFGMALNEIFKAHNIKFTATAPTSSGRASLAVACYKAGLKAHSLGSARKVIQRLGKKKGKR